MSRKFFSDLPVSWFSLRDVHITGCSIFRLWAFVSMVTRKVGEGFLGVCGWHWAHTDGWINSQKINKPCSPLVLSAAVVTPQMFWGSRLSLSDYMWWSPKEYCQPPLPAGGSCPSVMVSDPIWIQFGRGSFVREGAEVKSPPPCSKSA